MATLVKFHQFGEDLAHGVHNFNPTGGHTLEIALVNSANGVDVANDAVLADLTQISYSFLSSRVITTSSSGQTGGTYTLVLTDLTLTASGGDAAAFRYVVVFNQTATNDPLIGYVDYGSDVQILNGKTFDIDFGADGGTTGSFLSWTV